MRNIAGFLLIGLFCLAALSCGPQEAKPPKEYQGARILTQADLDALPIGVTGDDLARRFGPPRSSVSGVGSYLRYDPSIDYAQASPEAARASQYWVLMRVDDLTKVDLIISSDGIVAWPKNMKGQTLDAVMNPKGRPGVNH
jgi:hypothetical protein